MEKMKRIIIALLSCCFVITLAGCGKAEGIEVGKKGTEVQFGNYQGEPIEWIVLDRELEDGQGTAILLSKYNIDLCCYNLDHANVYWAGSDLREWINNDFYNEAFSSEEQKNIVPMELKATNEHNGKMVKEKVTDNVSLLSLEEMEKYSIEYKGKLKGASTYVQKYKQSPETYLGGWLRSPCMVNDTGSNADTWVTKIGEYGQADIISRYSLYDHYEGVRPMVKVIVSEENAPSEIESNVNKYTNMLRHSKWFAKADDGFVRERETYTFNSDGTGQDKIIEDWYGAVEKEVDKRKYEFTWEVKYTDGDYYIYIEIDDRDWDFNYTLKLETDEETGKIKAIRGGTGITEHELVFKRN